MKELKTKKMKKLLQKALRLAKKEGAPSDGMMHPLFTETLQNGWYYQADYVHDSRYEEEKFVAIHAFKPPLRFHARSATHYLRKAV